MSSSASSGCLPLISPRFRGKWPDLWTEPPRPPVLSPHPKPLPPPVPGPLPPPCPAISPAGSGSPSHAVAAAAPRPAHWAGPSPIPGRTQPPIRGAFGLQPELSQPQQAQRHPLDLAGPLHRGLGPGPALFPTQPLLEVPEHVLLAESPRKPFHHLHAVNSVAELTRPTRWR